MTMIKWILVLLLLPVVCLAEGQTSGSFTLSGSSQSEDNWMYENLADQGTNYSSDTFIYLDENFLGTERRGLIRFPVLGDSLVYRRAGSAFLGLVVLSEGITAAELVVHTVIPNWAEASSSWDNASTGGEGAPWNSEGCKGGGNDFYTYPLDSVDISSVSAGDTIWLDVLPSLDSGHYSNGYVLYLTHASNEWIKLYSSEAVGFNSFLYVEWLADFKIEPAQCSDAEFAITNGVDFYDVTVGVAPSVDCYLDSLNVRAYGIAEDTVIPLCYKNWDADSSLLEAGIADSVNIGDECADIMLQFAGTTTLLADSSYFFGFQHQYIVSDNYKFCCTGQAGDTGYYGISYPDSLAGSKSTTGSYSVCYTAYLTEKVAGESTGQVIIISKRFEDEWIFEGRPFRRISDGVYRSMADLVFGG